MLIFQQKNVYYSNKKCMIPEDKKTAWTTTENSYKHYEDWTQEGTADQKHR